MRCHSVLALLACLAAPALAAAQPAKADDRPNIVFCIADDWSWPHAGAYSDKVVQTPHFDKLAAEGLRCDRAYCVSPSCTPSRGAILTGQWIHRLEDGGNLWSMLAKQYVTYPDLLEAAGYVVGLTGKGWGPGNFKEAGRERNPAGPAFKTFGDFLATVPAGKPFCYWYGSTDPHRPYELGSGVKAGMKLADVQVPPIFPDTPAVRGDILDYYVRVQRFDAQLGALLKTLADSGRAANTLVIVTSDNGCSPQADFAALEALGHDPSHIFRGHKADIFDGGHRVPFLVRWPGHVAAGSTSDQLVCLTDLLATCAEIVGANVPDEAGEDSVSIRSAMLGQADKPLREAVVHHSINGSFAVRQGSWKFILCPDSGGWSTPRPGSKGADSLPPVQLFDLSHDPGEQDNVQDQHPEIVARLTKLMDRYVAEGRSTPGARQANQGSVSITP